ncbi:MAG: Nif11-like leader peptide family natural product precursor [Hyphomicrobiales bacterium]|nr:Nif11-like leader peptide family natural product precursor [Hyphomicrobiales bacterium]MBV9430082.1 Nif11-like leader peptide family natural product precursor [Bradyrhizobiaceae bacterium]
MNLQTTSNDASSSRAQLERFHAFVLENVALHDKLRRAKHLHAFAELLIEVGQRHGFAFTAQDVAQAMQATHVQALGGARVRVRETALPPPGWLPARAFWQDQELCLGWSYFGDRRLVEPFFEDSLRRSLETPFDLLFQYTSPIARLADWLAAHPGLTPRGFIFHMSRCGSTLVTQMLAALEDNLVLSEAPPLDVVVQAHAHRPDLSEQQQALWLAWITSALGQPRCGERAMFVKLDSWHTLALPLFRRAFPSVPWVFLYRDPVEVLVSQIRAPGIHTVHALKGAAILGTEAPVEPHRREDYCAHILARICEPVLAHGRDGGGLLINYRELPAATWTSILPHFGVAVSARERRAMAAAARYDAKMPGMEFDPDAEDKQASATPALRAAAQEHLGDLYARLETLRREES